MAFGNVVPVDLIRSIATPSPAGISNAPSASQALQQLNVLGSSTFNELIQSSQRKTTVDPRAKRMAVSAGGDEENVAPQRRPFVLTCQKWLQRDNPKFIFCRVNPRSVQWSMPLRIANQPTLAGEVQHAWRTRSAIRRTHFSEPTLTFNFQSGNIMPIVLGGDPSLDPSAADRDPALPRGLRNFYEFASLLDESRIIDDVNSDRRANVVYILYTSRIFPQAVLTGMFTPEGFSFSDDADDPNKVEWSAPFKVYDSFPHFANADEMIGTWRRMIAGTGVEDFSHANSQNQAANNAANRQQSNRLLERVVPGPIAGLTQNAPRRLVRGPGGTLVER